MIALYELERPALQQLSSELKEILLDDDRARFAALLELGDAVQSTLDEAERLIDLFLLPEDDVRAVPLWASLRRISRKRSMTKIFTSDHPSLEGRLRAYDVLRDDKAIANHIDRLLNPKRLPWYLRRAGATCGWLEGSEREDLVRRMEKVAPALTPELSAVLGGLRDADGDVVAHDGMS